MPMRCFYYFKDRSRFRHQPLSAPELKTVATSDGSREADRVIKSSCSTVSPRGMPELYEQKGKDLRVFEFSELRQATNDFSRLLKIGEGGFGSVYKGKIKNEDGIGELPVVAIKKLNHDGVQGHRQWVAEVRFLAVVDHPNLVKLIGYCAADGERGIQRLLVYEFMPNQSLEDHLFNKAYKALSWQVRLQILLGAARGLEYLHEGLEVQVIHRDFKSSNVLLDENFNAKLADFGLAREGPTADRSHVSTAVVGTYGYAAPDYVETGHLTTRSDVWSFGVVMYEALTGRRSMERNRPRSEQKLLEWIRQYPADSKRFAMIMDPRLENKYSVGAAHKIAKIADSCLHRNAKERPLMSQVVQSLMEVVVQDTSGDWSHIDKSLDLPESSPAETDNQAGQGGVSESWRRRMAHLAKLGEQVDGSSRRRFLMIQRAKVQ